MPGELNKEILEELQKINGKLDGLIREPQPLSKYTKVIALIIGFLVVGPFMLILLSKLFE